MLVCVSGCVTKPVPGIAPGDFAISGKFGIRNGQEGYSARFNWRQGSAGYDIEVWGPLGQGRTRLFGDEQSMQVQRGAEVLAQGEPQSVMMANLGWSVPLHVLPAWIRGEPLAELSHDGAVYDAEGHYVQFSQAGWQVSLSRYEQRSGTGAPVTPARIVAQNGVRKVTVIVREFLQ